jgi:hypothetical protein
MRYLTLFTHHRLHLWLAAYTGVADWCPLPALQTYQPQFGDWLCGCFSISQWEALRCLGVHCLTPRVGGYAVPDETCALRCLPQLVLAETVPQLPPGRSAPVAATTNAPTPGFVAGREALLSARLRMPTKRGLPSATVRGHACWQGSCAR